jgi:hypothetical protein
MSLVALTAIVAERQLVAAFPRAHGPADVHRRELDLRAWVMRHLGDPLAHPGRWDGVSARARQIFEWMLLADECQKIFAEFRRQSKNDERAEYWERKMAYVSDALFYKAGDTAVCLMRFDEKLVIEFGQVGNACYFYSCPVDAPPLRTLKLGRWLTPSAFKATTALTMGSIRFAFLEKRNHGRDWQTRFDNVRVFR